ncbi:MAG: pilus assembly protein TadG-related protein [Fimbriiglobus sp.]
MILTQSVNSRRRGNILPMTAILIVALCCFVALALDLGVLIVARTQCQNAADAGALASTRNLDNKPTSVNSNRAIADAAARTSIQENQLLAGKFTATNITNVRYGIYEYNAAASPARFEVSYPASPPPGRSWTATEVTVNAASNVFFARTFGLVFGGAGTTMLNTGARAVSVYRPRDIAMVLDMTGSMKFGSMTKHNDNYASSDPIYPQMGHLARYLAYSTTNSSNGTNAGGAPSNRTNPFFTTSIYRPYYSYSPNNFTVQNSGGPPIVKDFYMDRGNVNNPASTLTTPSVNMSAVLPATPMPRAFHHWEPTLVTPGNDATYTAATFNYSGWNGAKDINNFVIYPCPEDFENQSDANYLGDKWPRKYGAEWTTLTDHNWSPEVTNGAAINLIEYLGWRPRYTGGAVANPDPPVRTTPEAGYSRDSSGNSLAWTNFRDATWERYGYDLNVNAYVNGRPANWDAGIDPTAPASNVGNTGLPRAYTAIDARRIWWEANAASIVTPGRFKGYSMGPGYWGKTFFVWPPDPRQPVGNPGDANHVPGDWRRRFFLKNDGTQLGVNADNIPGGGNLDNIGEAILRNGTGSTLAIGTNQINYPAVLRWIKSPPMALPPNLRAGRVLYYSSIPNDVDTNTGTDDEKRDKAFWKYYIEYVLLNKDNGTNDNGTNIHHHENRHWPDDNGNAGNLVTSAEILTYDIDGTGPQIADPRPYMNYTDNPSRPRGQFWFGPVTMMGMIDDRFAMPGTVHQSQCWQLKAGVNSSLDDIRNNQPNVSVGMSYFSTVGYGFTSVAVGQEFELLKASLFYPKDLIDSGEVWSNPAKEVRAFDVWMNWQGFNKIQTSAGGTDPNTGLAVAFNILCPTTVGNTGNPPLPVIPPAPYANQTASRRGRRGAAKVVIFETDGVPNNSRQANYNALGIDSWYAINTGQGGGGAESAAYSIVDRIVSQMANGNTGNSGLSTPSTPARVYSIGFGDLFSSPSGLNTDARNFLLNIQKRGGTSGPTDTAIPNYQIITGTYTQRIESLRTAFERILQSGVQVTLIE